MRAVLPARRHAAFAAGLAFPILFGAPLPADPLDSLTASAPSPGYRFQVIARAGGPCDACPGGGKFIYDFEAADVNRSGAFTFTADLTTGGQGAFVVDEAGAMKLLARDGDPAPGGSMFFHGTMGEDALNDSGDVAFIFFLDGSLVKSGVYRYSRAAGKVTCAIAPGQRAPRGGTIVGFTASLTINDPGDIVALTYVDAGFPSAYPHPKDYPGVGTELLLLRTDETLSCPLRAGDAGPGGRTFDFFYNPHLNDAGDIAFGAHFVECPCLRLGDICAESIFLRKASGEIVPIALIGDAAPGGGTYRIAFGANINDRGDICFAGDLTDDPDPTVVGRSIGIFVYRDGEVVPAGRPGDPMPGGGRMLTASYFSSGYSLNGSGDVSFNATLDTATDRGADRVHEQGFYIWSNGDLRLVARTGTVIEGLGTVAAFETSDLFLSLYPDVSRYPPCSYWDCFPGPFPGAGLNDSGKVLFVVTARAADGWQGGLVTGTPVSPHYFLGRGGGAPGAADVVLSTDERIDGFSFGLILDGDCGGARIAAVDPGPDFPGEPSAWSVRISADGKKAAVEGQVAPAPSRPLGPGHAVRVAAVTLAGLPASCPGCRLSFGAGGDPPVAIAIAAAGGTKAATNDPPLDLSAAASVPFRRGDADGSGEIDLTDAISTLNYLFLGGMAPDCMDAADADDSGVIELTDAIYDLYFLFLGGPRPPAPGPDACGPDSIWHAQHLGCADYRACPAEEARGCGR